MGFIGLGIMGQGMVRNLLRAGHSVTVWNRTARPLPEDLGTARVASSVADAVADKPLVMICVTGPEAQQACLQGAEGAFANARAGALIADATTTDPAVSLDLAQAASARGLRYLDTPVFGSRNEAWEGRLDFVCGGARADYDALTPILESLAATTHYLGGNSKGASAKLIGNLLVAAQMASLGEALALARRAGLDPEALMGYLDVTDFSSALIRGVGRDTLADDYAPNFYLKHMLKDARLIGRFARDSGVPVPLSALIAEQYQGAVNRGLGDLNASALHKIAFEMSGLG
ncbi:2-hydroxy-3-oxopropionate reductase [Defluviimonas sp. 20V17]|nr:2-hydroxy-3-oxopropionate reductase [Defluviimonas sp. 20V17]